MASATDSSIKTLAEAPNLIVIAPPPGLPVFNPEDARSLADPEDAEFSVPVFDFATLTSRSPEETSRFGEVCRNWGFFILTNHGLPESFVKEFMEISNRFFQLPEEKKKMLKTSIGMDLAEYGTTPYMIDGKILQTRREFYSIAVHPVFHPVDHPVGFSEALKEFGERTREIAVRLIEAISESLGLKGDYIYEALNLDEAYQTIGGNYYPPYPQPDLAVGCIPHTDPGLVTLLMENDISGLEVEHNGKWVKVESKIPNSIYVNLADYMQILTNGNYKSAIHRLYVNDVQATRISQALSYGPPSDKIIGPLPELLKKEGQGPHYESLTYREYMKIKRRGT